MQTMQNLPTNQLRGDSCEKSERVREREIEKRWDRIRKFSSMGIRAGRRDSKGRCEYFWLANTEVRRLCLSVYLEEDIHNRIND